jgi:hypothetical protein
MANWSVAGDTARGVGAGLRLGSSGDSVEQASAAAAATAESSREGVTLREADIVRPWVE